MLFAEILPNLIAPIIVAMSIRLPRFIITEATLSFLGNVGVLPPTPTWGNMLEDSAKFFTVAPTYMFIPGDGVPADHRFLAVQPAGGLRARRARPEGGTSTDDRPCR